MGRRKNAEAPPRPRHSPRHEPHGDDDPFTPPRGSAPPAATEAPFDSSPATQESGREATLFSPETICMPGGACHIRRYSGATDEPMSRSSSQAQLPAAALVRCSSDVARNPLQLSQNSPMIITDITPRNTSQSPAFLDSSPHTHRAASHSATPADGFVTSSFREAHVKQMQRLLPSAAAEAHGGDAILTWMTALHPLTPQSRHATTPIIFGVNPSFAKAELPA
jgi:hypothetical protein